MGIVINNETGLAENIPDAEKAIAAGTHDVPLIAPDGQQMVAPAVEAPSLIEQGFRQPNKAELKDMLKHAEHSGTMGQVKAGLEGLASGATLGASVGIERALGVDPADIKGRAEAHPVTHAIGEAIGFAAPAVLAPEVAFTSKLGTAATRAAIDAALFQTGNEVSRMFMKDPVQTVESAVANIGLAGILGAGFGGALKGSHMLWESGPGMKLRQHLSKPEVIDALWSNIPSVVGGAVAKASGHNPLIGAAIGKATNFLGKEAPEAVHLAMLRLLGTAATEVDAAGVKAAAEMAKATLRADKQINRGVDAIFHKDYKDIFSGKRSDVEGLKKALDGLEAEPGKLLNVTGKLGAYMDEHATALGMTVGRAVQYLKSIKPESLPQAPLDSKLVASKDAEAKYDQALRIANNPLRVLESMRKGALTPVEIKHLQNLYPTLYSALAQKVTAAMVQAKADNIEIPYAVRQSLSMFLAQPLDSSMRPQSLQSIQLAFMPPAPKQQGMSAAKGNALAKMPEMYQTPGQAKAAHRAK